MREHLLGDKGEQGLGRHPVVGEGLLEERRALARGHRREDRPLADPAEVVGDEVDCRVSKPPKRGRVEGRRGRE
jgi:hypothetical protein